MGVYVDLRDSVYDSLFSIYPNTEILQSYDNGPEPVSPYIVFDIMQADQIGREYITTLSQSMVNSR